MRFPVVLLDMGGTLVGPSVSFGAVYHDVCRRLGLEVDPEQIERRIREVWGEMDRAIPPGRDRYSHFAGGEGEYWMRFAKRVLEQASGVALKDGFALRAMEQIRDAFMTPSAWQVFPDVRPALERMVDDGVRMAVVSNWDSRLPQVLEMLDLASYFEELAVSHLEGVEKPDPLIFHRVLGRMGIEPQTAVHVGDVPELDLDGARAAGIECVLIDRKGKIDATLNPIDDLSELPRIASGEVEWPSRGTASSSAPSSFRNPGPS
jgi:putative hydrolase of the HAD superfamily